MTGFDWLRSDAAWMLLLALIPLVLGVFVLRRRRRALSLLAEPRHLHRLFPTLATSRTGEALVRWLGRRVILRAGLATLAVLLLGAAYVGPVRGYALVPVAARQIDVMIVLDTSRSMWVEDVSPSRLERAKVEISALLDAMRGERAGLIGFAGLARSVAPLTRDMDTVRFFLERLDPMGNRKGGTDIGGALELALERFESGAGAGTQAIVLVTDGEDLTGKGLEVAKLAAERDIEIHVLGMGTDTGGKIPDGAGGFVVDPDTGEEVVSRLESSTLEALSSATGGIYLSAKGRVLPLEELYERAIAPMEGRDVIDGKERVPRDRYQWPLALAVLCALVSAALRDTRSARGGVLAFVRRRRGAAGAAAALFALLLVGCGDAAESDVEPWDGTLAEAVQRMDSASAEGDFGAALSVADRVLEPDGLARLRGRLDDWTRGASESILGPLGTALDAVGIASLTARERGEVELARGLVETRAAASPPPATDDVDPAEVSAARLKSARRSFGRAVGADAALRPAGLEALADLDLLAAEALRLEIPQIAQASGLPAPPPDPNAKKEGKDEDPIAVARAAYLQARAGYLACFAAGGRSDDARANSELVVKRLQELDELEEQQQDPQSDDSDDESESDSEQKSDDEQKESEESEQDQESEQEPQENESSEDPQEGEQDPSDQDLSEDPPTEPEDTDEQEAEAEEPEADPQEPEETEPKEGAEKEGEALEEKRLTAEELERLIERNREHQKLGEEVRKSLERRRRIPTERDW